MGYIIGNKVKTIKGFNDKIKHLITGYQKDIENLKAKRPGLQDLSDLDGVLEDLQVGRDNRSRVTMAGIGAGAKRVLQQSKDTNDLSRK